MRYEQLINESFKDAKQKFIVQSNNEEIVKEYLEKFKDLAKRNIIKGQDKDIGKWIKYGWDDFKTFIDSIKNETSSRQQKHEIKKDAIKLIDTDAMTVIIPLSEKSSCYYGKQTKWCTAASETENAFYTYFLKNRTLFYVIKGDRKIAANVDMNNFNITYFDARDRPMQQEEFESIAGINEDQLYAWTNQYKDVLNKAREHSLNYILDQISKVTIDDITVPRKHFNSRGYIQHITIPKIEPLLLALNEYFHDNHVGYKRYKTIMDDSLGTVTDVLKDFTDDTNELYIPDMEYVGKFLSNLYPPFNDYIKQLIGRHYEHLNTTEVKEINNINDKKEKDEAMYEYKTAIQYLLKILLRLKK